MFRGQIAGYVKRFQNLDLLTVKGAGHFVPTSRSGPALQMLQNFIKNSTDYSDESGLNTTPSADLQTTTPFSAKTTSATKGANQFRSHFFLITLFATLRLLSNN